jgi:cation diffusion facilitator CzcD-associated flavoprotein CzcO
VSLSLDVKKPEDGTLMASYDVIVMGAGPYGLSATAHLRAHGLKVAVFGKPIHLWRANMPKGMLLRSYWWATNLSDPEGKYDFEHYFKATGTKPADPLPIEMFIDYALWFQKNAVPDVDETYITNIKREDGHYIVTLEDGRVIQSKVVVMAPGLYYYNYIPEEYANMPSSLVTHSAEHSGFDQFAGKEVAVIGKGQAALESAALLHEASAKVHVVARGPVHWLSPVATKRTWLEKLRAPSAGIGEGWFNLLLEKYPYALHSMRRDIIDHFVDTRNGPAGSVWLRPRLFGKVTFHENVMVAKVEAVDERARITFTNGETLEVDHVILGTGYRPDVRRLTMLDKTLIDVIRTHRGSPVLDSWFETNIPGLYFVGFSAARSFGPFYRFVVGTGAASKRVAKAIARSLAPVR